MNREIKISNIIAVFLALVIGFSLCFYLFNVKVNLGWAPIFEIVRMRKSFAKYNADCLKYSWLVDVPGRGWDGKSIDSEFVFCNYLDD